MTPTRQSENQQQHFPSSPESEMEHQPNNNNKPVAEPIMLPITVDSGDDGSSELQVSTKVTVEQNDQNTDDTITAASKIWVYRLRVKFLYEITNFLHILDLIASRPVVRQ